MRIDPIIFFMSVRTRISQGERYGLALFNTLFYINKNLANEIAGTDLDPFYETD